MDSQFYSTHLEDHRNVSPNIIVKHHHLLVFSSRDIQFLYLVDLSFASQVKLVTSHLKNWPTKVKITITIINVRKEGAVSTQSNTSSTPWLHHQNCKNSSRETTVLLHLQCQAHVIPFIPIVICLCHCLHTHWE